MEGSNMTTNTNQKTQPHLVWELVRLADMREHVVCSVEQTLEDYEIDGRGDALAGLLPLELLDSANDHGEWHEEGLREVAQEAIDYARQHDLTLRVYDPHVWQDIEDGILDAEDLDVKWMGDPIWVRR